MPTGLNLEVSADVQQAVKALDDIVKKARKAGKELKDNVDKGTQPAADSLDKVTAAAARLNGVLPKTSVAFKNVSTKSKAATSALIDVSRVIQDAPYAILSGNIAAVANNFDPLVLSLKRTFSAAGSTGAGLKALAKGFVGAGGLGIAISAASSFLVLFGDKLFGTSKAAKELDEATKKLAEGVAGSAAKLTVLVGVVKNVNSSYDDKQKALRAINEEYGKYLPNLDKEKVTLENIGKAYDVIIDALLRQAVVKGIQDQVAKSIEETAKKIIAVQQAEEKKRISQKKANQENVNTISSTERASAELQRYGKAATDNVRDINSQVAAADSFIDRSNTAEERTRQLTAQLKAQLAPLLNLTTNFEDLDINLNKVNVKGESEIIKFAKFLESQFVFRPEIQFTKLDTKKEELSKARQILNDFFGKPVIFKVPFIPLLSEPEKEAEQTAAEFTKHFNNFFANDTRGILKPIPIQTDFSLLQALIDEKKKIAQQGLIAGAFGIAPQGESVLTKLQKEAVFTAQTINGLLTPAFQGLFDAIVAGENPMKAFFQSLGRSVQQLIQKLIAAAIQAAILSAIFPGGVGGAKGFGQIFGKILGFAAGGVVTGPTLALIGEGAGTSRSNPEVVAPLDRLRAMIGDIGGQAAQPVIVMQTLRGDTIRYQQARTERRQRRSFGV